jgi:hypothetical protein
MEVGLSKFAETESETVPADSTEMGDAYPMDEVRTREGMIMFQVTPVGYSGMNALDEFAYERTLALGLYESVVRKGQMKRMVALLRRGNRRLLDLHKTLKQMAAICPDSSHLQHYEGVQTVPVEQIKGSEGRVNDFDIEFYPVREHVELRWVNVAIAMLRGVPLPPVELVRVNDTYYVRDGHHRISVARAMKQKTIDAVVTAQEA